MSDDISRVSVRLFKILECAGVSEDARLMHREEAMNSEILDTLINRMRNESVSDYVFGSFSEGTTTRGLCSDIDRLTCHEYLPVIVDLQDAPAGYSALMITDPDTKPGYIKLQLVYDGKPATIFSHIIFTGGYIADSRGRYCLKHLSIVGIIPGFGVQRHGPADTIPEVSEILRSNDIVLAVRCKTVPSFASHWVNEIGQYGWPSRQLLDRMKRHGCFMVGVGHPQSEEKDIEWRVSFSLQEREIMFSLNPVQHRCYVVLKYIKHELITPEIGESLSSYHCKTSLFHVMKTTPQCLWKRENLVQCVLLCLVQLLKWTHDGHCPNFFVPDENMFDGRVTDIARTRLETKLRELLKERYHFLYKIKCDEIGAMLIDTHIAGSNDALTQCKYMMLLNSCVSVSIHKFQLYATMYKTDTPLTFLHQSLTFLNSTRTITEHDEQDTARAISLLRPVVQLMTAKYWFSEAFRVHDVHKRRQYQWLGELYLKLGAGCDMMQSRLLQASVLYRDERYDQCSLLLEEVVSDLKDHVVSCCGCAYVRHDCNMALVGKIKSENKSIRAMMSTSVAMCIVFLPSEIELIPVALQYELYRTTCSPPGSWHNVSEAWFTFAVTDAKIYLHFLQYLVYSKMNQATQKQTAIGRIYRILNTDPSLGHKDTAYNLLGWIYTQEGQTQNAFTCFMKSWNITPDNNAAKWHVGALVWKRLFEKNYHQHNMYIKKRVYWRETTVKLDFENFYVHVVCGTRPNAVLWPVRSQIR